MMLADMGAEVIALTRAEQAAGAQPLGGAAANPLHRGKTVEITDLKSPGGKARALDLIGQSDVLIEGFRPGVMERLGFGPAECAARNPKLVYGRMTGWGQDGPLSRAAGHDLNYVALTGLLSLSARRGRCPSCRPRCSGTRPGRWAWPSVSPARWSMRAVTVGAVAAAGSWMPPSSTSWP